MLPPSLDPMQLAYCSNYSTDDALTISPLLQIFTRHTASTKTLALCKSPHAPPTTFSLSFHLVKGSPAYEPSLPGWEIASFLRPSDFCMKADSWTVFHMPSIIYCTLCPAAGIIWTFIYFLFIAVLLLESVYAIIQSVIILFIQISI